MYEVYECGKVNWYNYSAELCIPYTKGNFVKREHSESGNTKIANKFI